MKGKPGPHPPPPADLGTRELPLIEVPGPFWRVHRLGFSPIYFGRTGENRFDSPNKSFGILYAGESDSCAFIETFGRETGVRGVALEELEARGMAELTLAKPVKLVNLDGPSLAKLGADARIMAGEHTESQQWSAELYNHPEQPDGLRYRARHDPELFSVALFERCKDQLKENGSSPMCDKRFVKRLGGLLDRYDFALF